MSAARFASVSATLRIALCALLLALSAGIAFAQKATDPTPIEFRDPAEEQRFRMLIAELRCVMCQNQSLADSNAQIAVDLRHEIIGMIREGRSDAEIREFLVARYGEFVLYRPTMSGRNWLLWFGPVLFALAGGLVVVGLLRRNRTAAADDGRTPVANDDEQEW